VDKVLIAPCGMNCGICMAYLREKNKCPGCVDADPYLRSYRRKCVIRSCETIKNNTSGFCYECVKYPCKRLKQLDNRYSAKYSMSMIENLEYIKEHGMQRFLAGEEKKWKCQECGGVISCHNGICYSCGLEKLKNAKRPYRWEE
jgi:hypothetical protein